MANNHEKEDPQKLLLRFVVEAVVRALEASGFKVGNIKAALEKFVAHAIVAEAFSLFPITTPGHGFALAYENRHQPRLTLWVGDGERDAEKVKQAFASVWNKSPEIEVMFRGGGIDEARRELRAEHGVHS